MRREGKYVDSPTRPDTCNTFSQYSLPHYLSLLLPGASVVTCKFLVTWDSLLLFSLVELADVIK